MKIFSTIAGKLPQFVKLVENMSSKKSPTLLVGASEIHKAHFIFAANDGLKGNTIVITHDEPSARMLVDDINSMEGKTIAFLYPARDFTLRQSEVASREYEQIRLGVLSRIQSGECKIVVASIDAAVQHTIPPEYLKERRFMIKSSGTYTTQNLSKKLMRSGYEQKSQVEGVAQFCVRGGIIDIFPPNHKNPVRIELWGDEVDTMAYFDIQTQRRTERIEKINITPANEVLFDSAESLIEKLSSFIYKSKNEKVKTVLGHDLDRLKSGISLNSLDKYLSIAYETPATIFDYFESPNIFISEYASIKERCKNYLWQEQEDIKQLLEEGELTKELVNFNESLPYVLNRVKDCPSCYMDTFARTNQDVKFADLISINPIQTSGFSGELKLLSEDATELLEQDYAVIVVAGTIKAASALAGDLKALSINADYTKDTEELSYGKLTVMAGSLSSGFEYPEIRVNLITTGKPASQKQRSEKFKKGKQLRNLTDLVKGDLVVHISHGIGIFEGINKLEMQGVIKDYIKISYAGSDTLYVPVTQLDLVSKYIGPREDGKVKLNKLHSVEWTKTRQRVKQAVADMADELILLYAKRMEAEGHAFSEDTEWQKDFEQHFPYTETDDQLRCAVEIKADMEKSQPMDRVLCGDVGFGKTEVAMRACFKAVMDSKQVAVLCPTTILAWQHFQSFTQRFEAFPIKVEVLSRFRTPKQQTEIIRKMKTGEIDIVIGTHRLVQKDIRFKDLGLAIVDEEQRFGVKHKEHFKEMFTNVDMLTLSATPIPRTLNMAISGIRDMSTIEQAPQDRHPVQSYVLEFDIGIIAEAIKKELRRGGQVYYIHNRIEDIDLCASKIHAAVPEARIATAHGRMDEKQLSEIWRQLLDKEIDILMCTTIIETGVDVANCNTLIIENADHMGLSQLYQLRGRVGRSNRRAFAYFTFTRGKVLTEISSKRLEAIREFTKFGSGFRIAMRDLEIRGAGNILGAHQHGHMEAVGYDMYLRLLTEAIAERKGEAPASQSFECLIDLRLDAHIPENYIDNTGTRIDIYKKIAAIKSKEDELDVTDELIDRFGDPPPAVISLLDVAFLRNTLAAFGFEEISEKPQALLLYPNKLDMQIVSALIAAMNGRVMVNASNRPYITVKPNKGSKIEPIALLREVVAALQS